MARRVVPTAFPTAPSSGRAKSSARPFVRPAPPAGSPLKRLRWR
jgi:hypothetical protein